MSNRWHDVEKNSSIHMQAVLENMTDFYSSWSGHLKNSYLSSKKVFLEGISISALQTGDWSLLLNGILTVLSV